MPLSKALRVACAICYLVAHFSDQSQQAVWDAYHFFDEHDEEMGYTGTWTETIRKRVVREGKHFMTRGTVENKKRELPPDPNSITPDEAKTASFILKSGYTEAFPLGHGRGYGTEHHYFTSLKQALHKSPQLLAIQEKFCLTNRKFLAAMYKYDPLLKTRRIHIKWALDDKLKDKRVKLAKKYIDKARKEPTFLKNTYFVDECAICFDHETRKGVHVYCDAYDKGYKFVIPFAKAHPSQKIKVHIMLAVNYYTGASFYEFTTGTTDIKRRENKGPAGGGERRYKVCVAHRSLLTFDKRACVEPINTRSTQHGFKFTDVGHRLASLIPPNPSVGMA